jgi:hypothetical protein
MKWLNFEQATFATLRKRNALYNNRSAKGTVAVKSKEVN